jgi:hypothetical protein
MAEAKHQNSKQKESGKGIIEHQICQDGMHVAAPPDILWTTICHQPSLDKFIKPQSHPASIIASLRPNKRLRQPD